MSSCERLHRAGESADGLILNPGAWTHYSWAIRDALEVAGLPAVEVHLSAVDEREEWRRVSVIGDLCIGDDPGQGPGRLHRGARAPQSPAPVSAARADRLVEVLAERGLDALVVTNLMNVRYLTGFTGTNGACVVGRDERLFFTDFRYVEQAQEQVPDFELGGATRDLLEDVAKRLRGTVGFEEDHVSVAAYRRLAERVPDGVELVPAGGLVEQLRAVKDETEIAAMAAAAEIGDGRLRVAPRARAGRANRARGVAGAGAVHGGPGGRAAVLLPDRGERRARRAARTRCRATWRSRATRSW